MRRAAFALVDRPFVSHLLRLIAVAAVVSVVASDTVAQTPASPPPGADDFLRDPPTETAAAEDDLALEPYSVYVAHDKMYARCGPSEEYYRTDPLRLGQQLDVYAETNDGWLGIRPPADSFCWIPADTVQLDATQHTGTINEDRTVAWIGTHLGRARNYRWQVQLAKGEPVTIVGRSEREGPDGPQLWFRIVPPSGEYRWVHREQVVSSSEELVAALQANAEANVQAAIVESEAARAVNTSPNTDAARATRSPSSATAAQDRRATTSAQPIGSGLRPELQAAAAPDSVLEAMKQGGLLASVEFLNQPRLLEIGTAPVAPQPSAAAGDENWVAGPRSTNASVGNPNNAVASDWTTTRASSLGSVMQVSSNQLAPPKQTVVSAERIAQIETEVQAADFDQLSLIFSRLIAAQATAAEVEPVQRAASQLAAAASDTVTAGRARLLSERAQQYRRVATRRDGEAVIRSDTPPSIATANYNVPSNYNAPADPNAAAHLGVPAIVGTPMPLATSGLANATPVPSPVPAPTAATQSGYLVQVYSARRNSPPFALTDATGRTIAYATPAPGVNLRAHLNSQVTVSGHPGFLTGLNLPHVQVTQVMRTPE